MAVRGDNLLPPFCDFLRGQLPPAEEEGSKPSRICQFDENKVEKCKGGILEKDNGEQGEEEDFLEIEQL